LVEEPSGLEGPSAVYSKFAFQINGGNLILCFFIGLPKEGGTLQVGHACWSYTALVVALEGSLSSRVQRQPSPTQLALSWR
jgi:hypothetical protein